MYTKEDIEKMIELWKAEDTYQAVLEIEANNYQVGCQMMDSDGEKLFYQPLSFGADIHQAATHMMARCLVEKCKEVQPLSCENQYGFQAAYIICESRPFQCEDFKELF